MRSTLLDALRAGRYATPARSPPARFQVLADHGCLDVGDLSTDRLEPLTTARYRPLKKPFRRSNFALEKRIRKLSVQAPELPGLADFLGKLEKARLTRNDLLHALPARDGLNRRRSDDLRYVRNFFSLDDLESATAELNEAHRAGSTILYHDGGTAIRKWYEAVMSASS